jgi:hypothetical protein
MASLEDASSAAAEDGSLEFATQEEEDAHYAKIEKARNKDTQTRRMTMMGGMGIQGPQEHIALFKLNPAVEDASEQIAKKAGSILSTVQAGVMGASLRPIISGEGFDWVFKVWFKSVEDEESYYGLVEDLVLGANAEELVLDSMMVDLAGLRGSIKAGSGELIVMLQKTDGANLETLSEDIEDIAPLGLTKQSLRPIHANEALFSGYVSMQPGFTDALLLNFDTAENLGAFLSSSALSGVITKNVPVGDGLPPVVAAYVF